MWRITVEDRRTILNGSSCELPGQPVVGELLVYYSNSEKAISALDMRSGRTVWRHGVGTFLSIRAVAADGKAVVVTEDGAPTLVRPTEGSSIRLHASGDQEFHFAEGGATLLVLDGLDVVATNAAARTVAVGRRSNVLTVLNSATGRTLRRLTLCR